MAINKSAKMTEAEGAADRQRATYNVADATSSPQSINAVARGLSVLSAFGLHDQYLGNHELAERTGLPKSTVSRISHTLAEEGFLRFDQRLRMYELGSKCFALGVAATANNRIGRILRSSMQNLADKTGWNVALSIFDQGEMMYVESCAREMMVGLQVYVGFRMPLLTTSAGRAYLAASEDFQREQLMLENPFGRNYEPVDIACEREAVDRALQNGFADSLGEWHPDINSVARAFVVPGSDKIFSLSIGAPKYALTREIAITEAGPKVRDCANRVVEGLSSGNPEF